MREEIKQVCGTFEYVPNGQTVRGLRFCLQVWHETLRLHPVAASGLWRAIDEKVNLPSGAKVPSGTDVLVPICAVHLDSEIYGLDANEFDPRRFNPDSNKRRNAEFGSCSFFPFSAGRKNCYGQVLATHEVLILLATILSRYEVTLACDPKEVIETYDLTLRPLVTRSDGRHVGLPVFLTRRSNIE